MCDKQRYTILIDDTRAGQRIRFAEYPDLIVSYVSSKNNLCPSNYDPSIKCVSAGELEVTLRVNGNLITLSDQDAKENKETIVGDYSFMGESPFIIGRSRDQTYLVFTICRPRPPVVTIPMQPIVTPMPAITRPGIPMITSVKPLPTEMPLTYNVNQPFIIEMDENVTTGYSWSLELPSSITQITDASTSNNVQQKVGAGGIHTFVLKGTTPGRVTIRAIYKRPWENRSVVTDSRNLKVYDVLIV